MNIPDARAISGGAQAESVRDDLVGKRESQATTIVRLAIEAGCELWHTPAGDGYITIRVGGHREHHPLASRGTRDYLNRLFYLGSGKTPNPTAMQAATATLSGIARFDGPEHNIHLRVAGAGGTVYLDLGDPQWRAIEITPDGYRLVADPPVRFRRTRGVLPLPVPVPGGSVAELRPFLNVSSEDDFALIVSGLVQMFRPTGPYPVIVLNGEQGTAKTSTGRVLRRMIDPNVSDVRSEPREARDLAVAADNGHVIAFDNLSRLPEWLSDALCRLATGGGFSTRTLYENREEEIFEAVRPVIVNGITQVATRPDLVDRAIVMTLPVIHDASRRDESEFWTAFETARPRVLGALLDAVVMALRNKPRVKLALKPRMADFAIWAVAAEPALPWLAGTFMLAYTRNRMGAVEATLDGDPVVDVVQKIAPWEGTATDLLAELNKWTPDAITRRKEWFSKPRQVADALRRLAPALRRTGIEVRLPTTEMRRGHNRDRIITVEKMDTNASASSAEPDFRPAAEDSRRTQVTDDVSASAAASADNGSLISDLGAADSADARNPVFSDDEDDAQYYGGA